MTLPYQDKRRWRWRWMQEQGELGGKQIRRFRLHRIAKSYGRGKRYAVKTIYGETVCGLRGKFHMPGIFSRMGTQRCPKCCKALGIPKGEGAPFNQDINA